MTWDEVLRDAFLRANRNLPAKRRGALKNCPRMPKPKPRPKKAKRTRASLPTLVQGMMHDVANVGTIITEKRGDRLRIRIDFGWEDGKRIRLDSMPSPTGSGKRIRFPTVEMAQIVLADIRAELVKGKSLEQALAAYRAGSASDDLVEVQLKRYVEHWEALVNQGKKSPNTLREIKTYARADGAFGHWYGKSIHKITSAAVEDWHLVLGARENPHNGKPISEKTQKNISDSFRTFLRWLKRRDQISAVPVFPTIKPPEAVTDVLTIEDQLRVLDAIPYEARGAFMAAANLALRQGEVRALQVSDYKDGTLRIASAVKGPRTDAPIGTTKNRTSNWVPIWNPELVEWIEARIARLTPEARLRGEVVLFPNPRADRTTNRALRWTPSAMRRVWDRACKEVGVDIPFQQGTRHTTATALAGQLPERALRAFTRHKDAKSLDHYTTKVRPAPSTIADIMEGKRRR